MRKAGRDSVDSRFSKHARHSNVSYLAIQRDILAWRNVKALENHEYVKNVKLLSPTGDHNSYIFW